MEVELLLAAGLAVGESSVLFCVPDHKLDLIAQTVVSDDLFGVLTGICLGEDDLFSLGIHQQYNPKITPEVGTVGHCRQDPNLRPIRKTTDLIEPFGKLSGIVPVNFAVVLFRSAGSIRWRTGG